PSQFIQNITVFFAPDHKTHLGFRGGKQEKKYSELMDCRHSTGDDQRLRTRYREMTRHCGHSTGDDQRLRTRYRG
ncbi:unnamed protein product, partial [Staurois parvus]